MEDTKMLRVIFSATMPESKTKDNLPKLTSEMKEGASITPKSTERHIEYEIQSPADLQGWKLQHFSLTSPWR